MVNNMTSVVQPIIHHTPLNPLIVVGLIFGGMMLFILVLILNAQFHIFKKIRIAFLYKTQRAKTLKVNMIYRNGQIKDVVVLYEENDTFNFEKGSYNINPKSFVNKKDKSEAYYFYGCPDAIIFEYEIAKEGVGIDSITYKKVLNEKIIKDLLESGKEEMFLIIVLILCAINMLMTGMILFGVKLSTSGAVK